ncbi:hypothetical protein J437_LFUL013299 [Ladona fulva]|uniref:Uncharacterized protein n=1 Tax=Ladona fulva TaxID=123851 RepID=A0A8K0KEY2_LADFU|nr:hypothetical protein J437_LFUL013299 [Ladona fulva]
MLSENKEVEELQEYINNTLKLLVKTCEGLIDYKLSEIKPDFKEPESIPPNSKMTTQYRFYQTMKERCPTVHPNEEFFKPVETETNINGRNFFQKSISDKSRTRKWENVCRERMEKFLGMLFHTGNTKLNKIQDYWLKGLLTNQLQPTFTKG